MLNVYTQLKNNIYYKTVDFPKGTDTVTRSCAVMTYCPLEEVERLAVWSKNSIVYIYHDSDVKEDGTPKEPHFHIIIKGDNDFRLTSLAKYLTSGTTNVEKIHNIQKAYEYFRHVNDPNKHQYSADLIQGDVDKAVDWLKSKEELKTEENACFVEDLETLSCRELALKYGRDYMRNMGRYTEFLHRVHVEENEKEEELRCTRLIERYERLAQTVNDSIDSDDKYAVERSHHIAGRSYGHYVIKGLVDYLSLADHLPESVDQLLALLVEFGSKALDNPYVSAKETEIC